MSKIIKARMVDNLVSAYQSCAELTYADGRSDFDLLNDDDQCAIVGFLSRISGEEVDLVFIGGDAFELNDNNYWLPNSLWLECGIKDRASHIVQAIGVIGGDL